MEQIKQYFLSEKPWISIVILILCIVVWKNFNKFAKKHLASGNARISKSGAQIGLSAVKYILAFIAVVVILQINGVNVSAMATGIGVAGVVIGFALQDFMKDWIMGLSIMWDGYFSVGDVVKYGDYEGKVVGFNLKATKIRDTKNGGIVTISNRNISEIEKVSDWCIVEVPFDYSVDAERMRSVCGRLIERFDKLENVRSCDLLGTDRFGESQVVYKILIHCEEDKKLSVRRAALGTVQDVFSEEKLEIPFSRLDVHIENQKGRDVK